MSFILSLIMGSTYSENYYHEMFDKNLHQLFDDDLVSPNFISSGVQPTLKNVIKKNERIKKVKEEQEEFFKNLRKNNYKKSKGKEKETSSIFGEGYRQRSIKSIQDSREKIQDPSLYPYSCIGLLSGRMGIYSYHATGFLIGPDIVLTSAHNCYWREQGIEASELFFSPGTNDRYGDNFEVSELYYPPEFKEKSDEQCAQYDYALLKLRDAWNVTKQYGYLGLDGSGQEVEEQSVEVCGYPGDKLDAEEQTMWKARGRIRQAEEQFLRYRIPTARGQSGSPVFKRRGEKFSVVGVHVRVAPQIERNIAVRLTKSKVKRINEWAKKKNQYSLSLKNQKIGENVKYLKERQYTLKIASLSLIKCGIKSIEQLSKGKWQNLKELSLDENNIADEEMKNIRKFPDLKLFSLRKCGITCLGMKILGQNKHIKIQHLNISDNNIGDQGIEYVSHFKRLRQLKVEGTSTTDEVFEIFRLFVSLETVWIGKNRPIAAYINNIENYNIPFL